MNKVNLKRIDKKGQKEMENALKEREEQLHYQARLLDNVSDAVISTDMSFRIKSWNRAAAQLYGWSVEEAKEKKMNEVVQTFYPKTTREEVLKEFHENGEWKGEVIQKNKAGDNINVLSSVAALRDSTGTLIGAVAVNRDISQRKQAEEALKESELRHRILAESSHDLIWEIDTEGNFIYLNSEAKNIYGYEPEEMIGKNFAEFMAPDSLVPTMHEFQRALQFGEGSIHFESQVIHKEGKVVLLDSHTFVSRDKAGNICSIMGTAQDITERKRTEAELLKLTQRFQISTKAAKVGIWDWDIKKDTLIWDDVMFTLYGLQKEQFRENQKSWLEHIHLDDLENLLQKVELALQGVKEFDTEFRIVWPDGTVRFIKALATVKYDQDGKATRMVGTNWDFTKEKEAEQQKIKAYQLELKNKELEQFAYMASHDLQEPLRTVRGFVGLLERRFQNKLDVEAKELLNYVSQAADRMDKLIKGLLQYSRIGSNKMLTALDCNVLLSKILDDLNAQISESDASFEIAPLPVINGYKTELRALFQNLISNAVKFRKPAQRPIIQISAQKRDTYWEFCVSDNGIGIAPSFQEQIFVIFQRLHPIDVYEGTGLGLAHCQKIVELHGGKIWVKSQPGQGSSFYFTIPE